ncbi:MAG: acylphosphatase [bacterium]
MEHETPRRRMVARFEGRVQGVGFRYTTASIAARFKVSGYVKNLPDGDVELVAEGTEPEVLAFLAAIRGSHLGRFIVRELLRWSSPTGEFSGFGVGS